MSEKRRLGRGLGALIEEALAGTAEVTEIPLKEIKPNPFQPRVNFDSAKMEELMNSIREHGVVQAVVVSPAPEGGYYVVAGERRCRAARMAGLTTIPALVREFKEKEMLEIALIENLQREDLNPIEEAAAYRRLMEEFNFTQEELGKRLGKSRSAIANTVRLLSLPPKVQKALISGELSPGQARPLLALPDPAAQEALARRIIEGKLTAREAERLAGSAAGVKRKGAAHRREEADDPLLRELQAALQRRLGTRVKISRRSEGGTIEIYFYGAEDLERLVELIMPEGIS
ncbi:MAG: ParB/RepB/Spo0J family partition protein [Firmicutes bacterium]|jgi:ParB family chromosome partitioning protein|nr:ParB/RepB/Spo0J family partition protein [Bacillota bacterium]HPU00560.1 ParB/RepB/Spo0J family partition protein [Bacillota bacterium]